ncbi:MAG: WYL domain-containing protein [Marichromatium sp.]|nr:WYL domain-containing protein [Marichromatium sp.]
MKHDIIRRFAFIETRLLWGGGFTAKELAQEFGIARQNAQGTIQAYQREHPGQMRHDRRLRRQVATESFEAVYIRDDVARFLDYQRAVNHLGYFYEERDWSDLPFQDADMLVRPLYAPGALRVVLEALRQERAVEIGYWSKSRTRSRLISPHHLVFADGRYHFRAYCHDSSRFLDFVLSRVMEAAPSDERGMSSEEDHDWHCQQELTFEINPDLPQAAQEALRLDFLPVKGELLRVPGVRVALQHYVRRRLCRNDWRFGVPRWVEVDTS